MKKTAGVLLILFCTAFALSTTAQAQVSVEAGVAYGEQTEKFGVRAGAYFGLGEMPLRLGVDGVYFFPDDAVFVTVNHIEGNANLHGMLVDQEMFALYALAGLNVTHIWVSGSSGFGGNASSSDTETALNLGGGLEFLNFGGASIFAEGKYIFANQDDYRLVLGAGVRLTF